MTVRRLTANGAHGWIAVAALVSVWDMVAVATGGESMSTAYRRALAAPGRRWRVTAAAVFLGVHLYAPPGWRRFDPLCRAAWLVERARSATGSATELRRTPGERADLAGL